MRTIVIVSSYNYSFDVGQAIIMTPELRHEICSPELVWIWDGVWLHLICSTVLTLSVCKSHSL